MEVVCPTLPRYSPPYQNKTPWQAIDAATCSRKGATRRCENGKTLVEDTREMALYWIYRWELHHLLNLCGLAVERTTPIWSAAVYGKELIVAARFG